MYHMGVLIAVYIIVYKIYAIRGHMFIGLAVLENNQYSESADNYKEDPYNVMYSLITCKLGWSNEGTCP